MPYATLQDLIDRYGEAELIQLTDLTHVPQTTVDGARVARALVDATALIDTHVARVASLPLAIVPGLLTRICADVARYYLHAGGTSKDGVVAVAYRDGLAQLQAIANGDMRLAELEPTSGAGAEGLVQLTEVTRVFDRASLRGM